MKAYLFDEKTKIYLQDIEMQLDPLESEIQKKEIWIIPANSTIKKVPVLKDKEKAVWNGKDWDIIEDNRGVKYWIESDSYYDSPREMKELGKLPKGARLTRPDKTLNEISQDKRRERDYMLKETDKYMIPDFPISEKERESYKNYRQYLRDIPNLPDFPNVDIMTYQEWIGVK